MNIRANMRRQKAFDSAQAAYDAMLPEEPDECIDDDDSGPDYLQMIENKSKGE